MSNSFKITAGDLSVGTGRSFERVSGAAKLAQDLRLWVLERIGTDPATPTYGSALDGGIIDGQEVPSYIGQLVSGARVAEIQAEVYRLLESYQQVQLQKMQDEMALFNGKHTLSADEVLASIESVDTAVSYDMIIVKVTIITAGDNSINILIPTQV